MMIIMLNNILYLNFQLLGIISFSETNVPTNPNKEKSITVHLHANPVMYFLLIQAFFTSSPPILLFNGNRVVSIYN